MWKQSSRTNTKKSKAPRELGTSQEAFDCALNLLSYRDHSESQLRTKLKQRGAQEEVAEESLAKLRDYGLVNEERFGQRLLEAWLEKGSYGRLHLQATLAKAGLKKELIQELLEQATADQEREHAQVASELFLKRYSRKLKALQEDKRKLYATAARFMAGRGFTGSSTQILLEKLHFEDLF